ncbi:MAG: hypothetical protein LBD52_00325 [Prevotellaceae bacterium]|jgi:hypothetical protein|nr:hypothetical protein [Prevotellaceae bacterium]
MDSPFVFSRPVLADNFVGRKNELAWLSANLLNAQHTVLIAPPNYGKKSLVMSAFLHLQKETVFKSCNLNLFNVRDEAAFYVALANALFRTLCTTSDEWTLTAQQLCVHTQPEITIDESRQNEIHLLFDESQLMSHADEILNLPETLATLKNVRVIVCIEDFQDVECFDNTPAFQKKLAEAWKAHRNVCYLLCGSRKNTMRKLFAANSSFYNFGEIIPLEPLDEKLTVDYIIKSYSKSGRVITKEFAEQVCRTVCGYPYYVQQLSHLCWLNTRGFVTETVVNKSIEDLYDYNHRLFKMITDALSPSQLNYMRAVIDGTDRFSSAESLAVYKLHSSANIARVREALEKKEIMEFGKNNKPVFVDPVFELWFRRRYMNK